MVKVPINSRTQFLTTSSLHFCSTFFVYFTELWTTKVALLIYENGLKLLFGFLLCWLQSLSWRYHDWIVRTKFKCISISEVKKIQITHFATLKVISRVSTKIFKAYLKPGYSFAFHNMINTVSCIEFLFQISK